MAGLILRGDKGSKLTAEEMDNNLVYLESNGGGDSSTFRILNNSNDGETILTTDKTIFINITDYTSINLYMPDPSEMAGKTLFFKRTDGGSENWAIINGFFYNENTSYSLYGYNYNNVTFISDGISWYQIT